MPPRFLVHRRRRHFAIASLMALLAACGDSSSAGPAGEGETMLPDGTPITGEGSPGGGNSPSTKPGSGGGTTTPVKPLKTLPEEFVSALVASKGGPGGANGGFTSAADAGSAAPTTASGVGTAPGLPTGALAADSATKGAAERAIAEADVLQVAGDTLYALSRVAGLTVVDIANPAAMRILGSYRALPGTPFEMYLRDGVVLAMYTSYGQYTRLADGSYDWVTTSKVLALDARNPAAITQVGSFDVAGEISDSRLVGNTMYVVGYENGYCWRCQEGAPRTTILSLDVTQPAQVRKVDELAYAENNANSWGKRSITVTDQRMYVAGPEYATNSGQPTGSTIQVVDISDPAGDLVEGTHVTVNGAITSRWQMDEYQGVLRVISQPASWWWNGVNAGSTPRVETYRVNSSQSIAALGSTNLVIPPNETLQSVRFDGTRGYAITAMRTDPLITIDLSDPAHPAQRGELVMPGSIYYMEPRGNRVVGLGFDNGNAAGGITVSVFDVSNLSAPRMLDRVNFGGTWANLPEDQDRIHKAFKILDDRQLVLVPFSGWSGWNDTKLCSSEYRSGIQLVDMKGDDLTLRGMAPSRGEARRALIHRDKLLALSDEAVDAFDITDRDKPQAIGNLTIARNVSRVLPMDAGYVARVNENWYGNQDSTLDFVKLADVARPDVSVGSINLAKVLSDDTSCYAYAYVNGAFAEGTQINLAFSRTVQTDNMGYRAEEGVATVDASDPAHPKLASRIVWPQAQGDYPWYPYYASPIAGYLQGQKNTLRTDSAFVRIEQRVQYNPNGGEPRIEYRLRVVDLRDPAKPVGSVLALPKAEGYSGLTLDGTDVLFSHHVPDTTGEHTRFYVNRVNLADPSKPTLGADVNVPGALLEYDAVNRRALTTEIARDDVPNLTPTECQERFALSAFEYPDFYDDTKELRGTCRGYTQSLHLVRFVTGGAVRDDSLTLDALDHIAGVSVGGGRALVNVSGGYGGIYYGGIGVVGRPVSAFGPVGDCFDCGYGYGFVHTAKPAEVLSLGGFDTGTFVSGRLTVDGQKDPWWGYWGTPHVYASGNVGLVIAQQDALVLNLADAAKPVVDRKVPLYGYVADFATSGKLVLLAEGMQGVQRIDL